MIRKRKLHKIQEAVQVKRQRLGNWFSLVKGLQEVLGDSAVCAGLTCIANLGMRLVTFGRRDKDITDGHLGECKGKSIKEAAKPFMLMKL